VRGSLFGITYKATGSLAFDFTDGSGMNSKTLDKLIKVHQALTKEIDGLEDLLKNNKQLLEQKNSKEISNKCQQVLAQMKQVKNNLENRITEIKDYQSPDTKEKICSAKQLEIRATINILKAQKPITHDQNNLINSLKSRENILGQFAKSSNAESIDSNNLLGRKQITGIGKLLNFRQAIKQEIALNEMANTIISSEDTNIGELTAGY
jgi:hypothetical protein